MNRREAFATVAFVSWLSCAFAASPCPPEGSSKQARIQALDRLKNRTGPPLFFDSSITLERMLEIGDDTNRFRPDQGATIQGYVALVKPGGPETCHCGKGGVAEEDTHIAIVSDPTYTVEKPVSVMTTDKHGKKHTRVLDANAVHHVIVEATPQFRAINRDTPTLRKELKPGTRVRVTGWLFFDAEHVQNAFNTNPHGTYLWRAAAWEIHPVTKIEVIK